jgi:hypothetical protein
MHLTQEEHQGSQLVIDSFSRVDALSRRVVFRVIYDGETMMFSEVVNSKTTQTKDFYINKAFRKLRKQMVAWIKAESQSGGVVGRQYAYSLEDWNKDVEDNIDESTVSSETADETT